MHTTTTTPAPVPHLVSTQELAERLYVDRSTVIRWVKDGVITPSYRMPGRTGAYLFTPDEVDRLVAQRGRP
jgi:excisionase family DNA binding protein